MELIMHKNIKTVLIPILSFMIFSPLEADTLVDMANRIYSVNVKKVDDEFIYCTGKGFSGLMRVPINTINSLIIDDDTVIIKNNELVQTYDTGFDHESFYDSDFDPEMFNYGSETKRIKTQMDFTSFGYGCVFVSGILGLVNNNREYKGESLDDLESFADQTKLIQNFHYGFMIIGAGVLLYGNNVMKNNTVTNSSQ